MWKINALSKYRDFKSQSQISSQPTNNRIIKTFNIKLQQLMKTFDVSSREQCYLMKLFARKMQDHYNYAFLMMVGMIVDDEDNENEKQQKFNVLFKYFNYRFTTNENSWYFVNFLSDKKVVIRTLIYYDENKSLNWDDFNDYALFVIDEYGKKEEIRLLLFKIIKHQQSIFESLCERETGLNQISYTKNRYGHLPIFNNK